MNIVGIVRNKMTNLKTKHAELVAKSTEYGREAILANAQIGECLTPQVLDTSTEKANYRGYRY